MGAQTMPAKKMERYVFHAQAVAAYFQFTDGNVDFGHQHAAVLHGDTPHEHRQETGARSGPEISFTRSFVDISCQKQPDGVFTTVARSGLEGFSAKGVVTADVLECGFMSVYREQWYNEPSRPKRARMLPLPPVIENLRICGEPYRLNNELRLPEAFEYDDSAREKYFDGEGTEIEPVAISTEPGRTVSSKCGQIEISSDTRRIAIPGFGIVCIADWTWLPADIHTAPHTAQWVQLVGLDLKNPGKGGGSGAGGNGSSG
jgi:hypothetical protein